MIYLITSMNGISEEEWLKRVKTLMDEGLDNVIIREKELDFFKLEELVREIKRHKDKNVLSTRIIINTHIELAEKYKLDGVHIPYNLYKNYDKACKDKLIEWKEKGIIGFSAHSIEEIKEVEKLADYVLVSPTFKPSCKDIEGKGIHWIKDVVKESNVEIVALGGIDSSNVHNLYGIGINSVGIMSKLMEKGSRILDFKRK